MRSARVRIEVPGVTDQLAEDAPVDVVQRAGPSVRSARPEPRSSLDVWSSAYPLLVADRPAFRRGHCVNHPVRPAIGGPHVPGGRRFDDDAHPRRSRRRIPERPSTARRAVRPRPAARRRCRSGCSTTHGERRADDRRRLRRAAGRAAASRLYRRMVIGRRFNVQATALTKQGRLAVYPSSHGQEACQVARGAGAAPTATGSSPPTATPWPLVARGVDPVEALTLLRGDWHCGYDPHEHQHRAAVHAAGHPAAARRRPRPRRRAARARTPSRWRCRRRRAPARATSTRR